jgi:carboxylesterase type B
MSASSTAGLRFGVVVDGKVLPDQASRLLAKGQFNDVPMLVGQTANEGSAFPGYGAGDAASYKAFLNRSFGQHASARKAVSGAERGRPVADR